MSSLSPAKWIRSVNILLLTALVSSLLSACEEDDLPELSLRDTARTFTVGQVVTPFALINNGGEDIKECFSTPELPQGLRIRRSSEGETCIIDGTPTVATDRAIYSISARNKRGFDSVGLILTVFASLIAPEFQGLSTDQNLVVNTAITPIRYVNNGGESISSCIIDIPLPTGLRLAPNSSNNTCEITGTPTIITARRNYRITAINAVGMSSGALRLGVIEDTSSRVAEPDIMAPGIPTFTADEAIDPIIFNNSGGSPTPSTGCGSDPALPDGLNIELTSNGNSCQISGTPTTAQTQLSYTITATNSGGSDSVTITITIN